MKVILLSAIVVAAASMAASASAAGARWCAMYGNGEAGRNCSFATRRQCMAEVRGKGGWCQSNIPGPAQYLRY